MPVYFWILVAAIGLFLISLVVRTASRASTLRWLALVVAIIAVIWFVAALALPRIQAALTSGKPAPAAAANDWIERDGNIVGCTGTHKMGVYKCIDGVFTDSSIKTAAPANPGTGKIESADSGINAEIVGYGTLSQPIIICGSVKKIHPRIEPTNPGDGTFLFNTYTALDVPRAEVLVGNMWAIKLNEGEVMDAFVLDRGVGAPARTYRAYGPILVVNIIRATAFCSAAPFPAPKAGTKELFDPNAPAKAEPTAASAVPAKPAATAAPATKPAAPAAQVDGHCAAPAGEGWKWDGKGWAKGPFKQATSITLTAGYQAFYSLGDSGELKQTGPATFQAHNVWVGCPAS